MVLKILHSQGHQTTGASFGIPPTGCYLEGIKGRTSSSSAAAVLAPAVEALAWAVLAYQKTLQGDCAGLKEGERRYTCIRTCIECVLYIHMGCWADSYKGLQRL